ncbi:hypothetical protein PsorP6_015545 [Peronosclerospora sorghi]|uniref:Uncharacterized protein n=1 Tax=Peronosclerospora sorghi TaxID=230839 RepID=A0ACC0WME6_9STRA|nr:hypothetical protein PsorP6_015545 [Peronosclerospora sorghi]
MRISSVVLLASCSVSVTAAREFQLTNGTSATSPRYSIDESGYTIAMNRLQRAVEEAATTSEEARTFPGMSEANEVSAFVKLAHSKGLTGLDWAEIEKKAPRAFTEVELPSEETPLKYADYLVRAFERAIESGDQVEYPLGLIEVLIKHFGQEMVLYVLFYLQDLSEGSVKSLAEKSQKHYFEYLILNGLTPSDVCEKWKKLPLFVLVENLNVFIEMYNKEPGDKETNLLQTLRDSYEKDDYVLVRKLSLSTRLTEMMTNLHRQLVKTFPGEMTIPQLFKRLLPNGRDKKWDFTTLAVFAYLFKNVELEDLLSELRDIFGGYDKLAPVLAEASIYDTAAKFLQGKLVDYFIQMHYTLDNVFDILKLRERELTDSRLSTLKLFAKKQMKFTDKQYDFSHELHRSKRARWN